MTGVALRPRSAAELVDAAAQLLRRHYQSIILVSSIGVVPRLVLQPVALSLLGGDPRNVEMQAAAGTSLLGFFVIALLSGVWYTLTGAAVIAAASQGYIEGHVDVGAAVRRVLSRISAVLYASLVKGLAVGFGVLLFLVGSAYFYTTYFAVPTTVIVEGRSGSAAIARSAQLASGNRWRVFKPMLLAFIIYFIVVLGTSGVAALAGVDSDSMLGNFINAAAQILVWPLVPITEMLVYYDLRIRDEGYDVEVMASNLGDSATAPAG